MNRVITLSIIVGTLYCFTPLVAAKEHCQKFRDKLDNIQAQQRQGNAAKKGLTLRDREDAARDKWWQCEHTTGITSTKSKAKAKTKTKAKAKAKQRLTADNNNSTSTSTHTAEHQHIGLQSGTKANPVIPFSTTKPIVIASEFTGAKLAAWLQYYQQPSQCGRPKTTQLFAYCVEQRKQQQVEFEKHYATVKSASH